MHAPRQWHSGYPGAATPRRIAALVTATTKSLWLRERPRDGGADALRAVVTEALERSAHARVVQPPSQQVDGQNSRRLVRRVAQEVEVGLVQRRVVHACELHEQLASTLG